MEGAEKRENYKNDLRSRVGIKGRGNEIMEGEENVIRYTMEWTRVTSRSKPPSVEDRRNKGNGCYLNIKETDSRWELQSRWFASRSKPCLMQGFKIVHLK